MTECQVQVNTYSQNIAWNSGKFITQLGLFDECTDNQNFKYGLLDFFNKTTGKPLGVMMGACAPQVCSKAQIQDVANLLLESADLQLTAAYIENPLDYDPGKGAAFYITICVLALLFALMVIGTIFSNRLKKVKVLSVFNLKNSIKIFEYKHNNLNIFNGVKTIAMMWVIFGHLYSVRLQNCVNALDIEQEVESTFFLFVIAAFFAVDVFFYIGGFLVAYSFLRSNMKSLLKYPLAIVHRLLRFWPSYIMTILIYYSLFLHAGSGPLWWLAEILGQVNNCASMWKPLIFVDNLVDNGQSMCLGWGWYLQNDMQIFIFSVPLLFLYSKKRKPTYIIIALLILASSIINIVEVQTNQYITVTHRKDFIKWNSYFPNVYIKPWIRCTPYLYGLFLGLLFMEFLQAEKSGEIEKTFFGRIKRKLQNNKNLRNGSQILGIMLLLFIILIPRTLQVGVVWPQILHTLYLTFGKLIFVFGMSLIVTPTLLGVKNDFMFFLLDTKLFNFTGKISFWTYLIHYMIVQVVCFSQKTDFYYDIEDILGLYLGIVILSLFFGFCGTLLVEVPFAKLQKMLFEGKKKDKSKKQEAKKQVQKLAEPTTNQLNATVTSQLIQKND